MNRAPDTNARPMLIALKDAERIELSTENRITIAKNCKKVDAKKYDIPKDSILSRFPMVVLAVMAIVGKNVRKSNCVYTAKLIL
jgi:hypothetical protein